LEARRRLAKRKNMGLASVGAYGPPVDIGALFGKDGVGHDKWASNNPAFPNLQAEPSSMHFYVGESFIC
jgi:hypothetical protein